jgi:hypothetical protein
MSDSAVAPDTTTTTSKLEEVAASIGSRIWDRKITTEAGAHLAVIANLRIAEATSIEVRRAVNTWLIKEHGDDLRAMSWRDRNSAIDWALKSV